MAQSLSPTLAVLPSVTVQRLRELPGKGELLVNVGDAVTPQQVVGRAMLPGDLHILRIGEKLGIEPDEVLANLKVKVGDAISTEQVLFERRAFFGLLRSEYRSPVSGELELIVQRTGHLGVRASPREIPLTAYLAGRVAAIKPGYSVTIEATVALCQGIFGVGGERSGTLLLLDTPPTEIVDAQHLPQDLRGRVLVGGARFTIAALRAAEAGGAVGVVTGSIDDRVLHAYLGYDLGVAVTGDEDIPLSLIVTEGFGLLSLSERVLALLRPLDGRAVSLNGATQVRAGAVRPEILVPLDAPPVSRHVREAGRELMVGSSIRLVRVPYFGLLAKVVELPTKLQALQSGVETRVLRARLADGREVVVPRANVEVV